MTQHPPIRERWIDRAPDDGARPDDDAARAGALLRQVPEPPAISDEGLARVHERLAAPRRGAGWRWSAGILPVLLLLALLAWRTARSPADAPLTAAPTSATPLSVAPTTGREPRPAAAPASADTTPPLPPPAPAAPPSPTPVRAPAMIPSVANRPHRPFAATVVARSTAEPAAATTAPAPLTTPSATIPEAVAPPLTETDLAAEARLLGAAARSLRQDHDATTALARLDEYRARFPRGTLRPEAALARVDAVLALGRRAEALALLEGLDPAHTVRARELRVLRGELRSGAGRCAEASLDFAAVFDGHDALEERARHGRATCRAQAGDWDGARADLRDYLARFPDGRFAADAHRRLQGD